MNKELKKVIGNVMMLLVVYFIYDTLVKIIKKYYNEKNISTWVVGSIVITIISFIVIVFLDYEYISIPSHPVKRSDEKK